MTIDNYDDLLQKCSCGRYIQDSPDFPRCSCGSTEKEDIMEEDFTEDELHEAAERWIVEHTI